MYNLFPILTIAKYTTLRTFDTNSYVIIIDKIDMTINMSPHNVITNYENNLTRGDTFGGNIADHGVVSSEGMILPGVLLFTGAWICNVFLDRKPQIVKTTLSV